MPFELVDEIAGRLKSAVLCNRANRQACGFQQAFGVVTETIGIGARLKLAERILVCIQEPPGPEPDPIPRAATSAPIVAAKVEERW